MTVTRKALDGVEFMRVGMVDAMRAVRKFFANQNDSGAIPSAGQGVILLSQIGGVIVRL
jgi:hypothetical protein